MDQEATTKAAFRSRVRARLDGLSSSLWEEGSEGVCRAVAECGRYQKAGSIFAFVPIAGEVDITPLLEMALAQGKALCLPRIDWETRTMVPASVTALNDTQLETTRNAIRQPNEMRPVVAVESLDLMLVPGLAFSRGANGAYSRLGRGAGFYDRFFESHPSFAVGRAISGALGVALREQILSWIPSDPWDVSVPAVATPDGVMGSV